jgi:hypothetical protein
MMGTGRGCLKFMPPSENLGEVRKGMIRFALQCQRRVSFVPTTYVTRKGALEKGERRMSARIAALGVNTIVGSVIGYFLFGIGGGILGAIIGLGIGLSLYTSPNDIFGLRVPAVAAMAAFALLAWAPYSFWEVGL